MDEPNPFDTGRARLAKLGIKLVRLPGEYRVGYATAGEAGAEFFETVGEAIARGDELATLRPLEPPAVRRRGKAARSSGCVPRPGDGR